MSNNRIFNSYTELLDNQPHGIENLIGSGKLNISNPDGRAVYLIYLVQSLLQSADTQSLIYLPYTITKDTEIDLIARIIMSIIIFFQSQNTKIPYYKTFEQPQFRLQIVDILNRYFEGSTTSEEFNSFIVIIYDAMYLAYIDMD